jgi:hypothetical protein
MGAAESPVALDSSIQAKMERAFGRGFSDVRIHESSLSAGETGIRAATRGSDIYLAQGEYHPSAPRSEALIAHELAHVVQQRAGDGAAGRAADGRNGRHSSLESEAESASWAALTGRPVEMGLTAPAGAVQLKAAEGETPTATGYIGMNVGAEKELAALKRSAKKVKNHRVIGVIDDPKLEGESGVEIVEQAKKHGIDLYADGAEFLLVFFGIGMLWDDPRMPEIIDWLKESGPAKDSVAGILKLFYEADLGKYKLERLIFSGHSGGEAIWGKQESSGELLIYEDIPKVARLFPKAAEGVEDIMFSACFSFSLEKVEAFIPLFPNLQSVWAYLGFSPDALSGGSLVHIRLWEQATRGHSPKKIKRKGHNVAVWTRDEGTTAEEVGGKVQLPARLTPAKIKRKLTKWVKERLPLFMDGSEAAEDGIELRSAYTACQILVNHPDADDADRPRWKALAATVLRLRKWEHVREHFATKHAELLKGVFYWNAKHIVAWVSELKRALIEDGVIDTIEMTKELLASGQMEERPNDMALWTEQADRLLFLARKGLRDLDPKLIPESWCG